MTPIARGLRICVSIPLLLLAALLLVAVGCSNRERAPKAAQPEVVHVSRLCRVTPLGPPPAIRREPCGPNQDHRVCFDRRNAEAMQKHIEAMERWIAEARKNCGIRETASEHPRPWTDRTPSSIPLTETADGI